MCTVLCAIVALNFHGKKKANEEATEKKCPSDNYRKQSRATATKKHSASTAAARWRFIFVGIRRCVDEWIVNRTNVPNEWMNLFTYAWRIGAHFVFEQFHRNWNWLIYTHTHSEREKMRYTFRANRIDDDVNILQCRAPASKVRLRCVCSVHSLCGTWAEQNKRMARTKAQNNWWFSQLIVLSVCWLKPRHRAFTNVHIFRMLFACSRFDYY